MIKVEINNMQQKLKVDKELRELFETICRNTARLEGFDHGEISIALVDNEEIRGLNKKYRDVDEATDILSFPLGDEILGDIIISVERAVSQAEEYGHSLKRELCYLLIHGVLHILGYDHKNTGEKDEMRKKEERVLGELNIIRD